LTVYSKSNPVTSGVWKRRETKHFFWQLTNTWAAKIFPLWFPLKTFRLIWMEHIIWCVCGSCEVYNMCVSVRKVWYWKRRNWNTVENESLRATFVDIFPSTFPRMCLDLGEFSGHLIIFPECLEIPLSLKVTLKALWIHLVAEIRRFSPRGHDFRRKFFFVGSNFSTYATIRQNL
jgi:hypothetical protein